jgi:hypothetical protein
MFGFIATMGFGSACAYGLYSGAKGYIRTTEKKKELVKNIIEFRDIGKINPNVKTMVSTTVETNSGLLKLFKMKEQTNISYLKSKDTNLFVVNPNVVVKKHIFSQLIEPKLGLRGYNPTLDGNAYLFDNVITEKREGTGYDIGSDISTRYGLGNLLLDSSNKYSTVYYPLKNKTVFMYGFTNTSGDFVSEIVGTDKHLVAERVFKSDYDYEYGKLLLSLCGFVTTVIVAGISKN